MKILSGSFLSLSNNVITVDDNIPSWESFATVMWNAAYETAGVYKTNQAMEVDLEVPSQAESSCEQWGKLSAQSTRWLSTAKNFEGNNLEGSFRKA